MSEQNQPTTTLLTSREVGHIVAAFQSLEGDDIKLDWDKFVALSEYSTVNSARSHFSGLKKKLSMATTDNYYVATATNGTPKSSPRKPRAKAPAKSKDDTPAPKSPNKRKDHATNDATPSKRSKDDGAVKKEEDAEEASAATEEYAHDSEI